MRGEREIFQERLESDIPIDVIFDDEGGCVVVVHYARTSECVLANVSKSCPRAAVRPDAVGTNGEPTPQ